MAATPSTMIELGTPIPDFLLIDTVSQRPVSSKEAAAGAKGTLVMFICNHCPFVKHIQHELVKIGLDFANRGLKVLAISSNDIEKYPDDSPEKMVQEAQQAGYTFPYLFDESQEVAKSFKAACTPDFFLYDAEGKLAYRGQLDDSRPSNGVPVTGRDLRMAIEAVLAGQPVGGEQVPSIGCNIKWKPGHEPDYAR